MPTWSTGTIIPTGNYNRIVWADSLNLFVAVGSGASGQRIATSPDGVIWTGRSDPVAGSPTWQSLAWNGSVLVAVSSSSNVITSPDGVTWTERTPSEANSWMDVCWAAELTQFVAVANTGTHRVMTSPDGISWTNHTASSAKAWSAVAWSSELTLLVATATTTGTASIMSSPDGVTWTDRSTAGTVAFSSHGLVYAPALTMFVAGTTSSSNLYRSTDGITWTNWSGPPAGWTQRQQTGVWCPEIGQFVFTSNSLNNQVLTSSDGITWAATLMDDGAGGDFFAIWQGIGWSPTLSAVSLLKGGGSTSVYALGRSLLPNTVTPDHGPVAGDTAATLTGTPDTFADDSPSGYFVFVDNYARQIGIDLTDPELIWNPAQGGQLAYSWVNDAQLTCVTHAQPCGPTDVYVVDMTKLARHEPNIAFYLPLAFTYQLDAPTLTDIAPTSGAARGGTHVVLTGSFSCVTCSGGGTVQVEIGGVPLTSVGCSADTLTGITGVHAAGVVDVVVINPDGQRVTLASAYTYIDGPTVTHIDPDHGPDAGGTAVTITGTGFQTGASVMFSGLVSPDTAVPPSLLIADAFDVVVVNATTITATTSGSVAGVYDVVVTNPDGQRGTLEQGYSYDGWWTSDLPTPVWSYGPTPPVRRIPGRRWRTEAPLAPPVDGWWMSTAAYGGDILIVASSRPKDPRRWNQIATFATGSAAMLGGSPGIAGVYHNRMVYAASDYTVGTTAPPLRIYDGSFDRELCRLPPTSTSTVATAVLALLIANGTIYVSTFDSGSSSADWVGRVFALDLNTATLSPIGAPFPAGHLPYALTWHNGMLWCGTHRQATDVAGKIFRIRPDIADPAWTEDATLAVGFNVAALCSWHGILYAGTTAPAGTFAQIRARATDGTWSVVDTGSGGTATANNGFLAFCPFGPALFASYWNADTPAIARVRVTRDGTSWSTSYGGAAGTLRPFIVLTVDKDALFAIGGGAHLTAAIVRCVLTPDGLGELWSDLTLELPDTDKTALPAVATLVL